MYVRRETSVHITVTGTHSITITNIYEIIK